MSHSRSRSCHMATVWNSRLCGQDRGIQDGKMFLMPRRPRWLRTWVVFCCGNGFRWSLRSPGYLALVTNYLGWFHWFGNYVAIILPSPLAHRMTTFHSQRCHHQPYHYPGSRYPSFMNAIFGVPAGLVVGLSPVVSVSAMCCLGTRNRYLKNGGASCSQQFRILAQR